MKNTSRISGLSFGIILLAMVALLSSCRQKELYYPEDMIAVVDVEFIWNHAGKASVEGMSVYFFPLDSDGKIWNFEIAGKEGGPISIPYGNYIVVAINNDLPGIDVQDGTSISDLSINAIFKNDSTIRPSGMVYGCIIDQVAVTPCGVRYISGESKRIEFSRHTIEAFPDSLATVYNILINGLENHKSIAKAKARLNGVATSLLLEGEKRSQQSSSINIPLSFSDGDLYGTTSGLGTPAGSPRFIVDVSVQFQDGKSVMKSFDVTDQVVNAAHPHNVTITINGNDFNDSDPDPPDSVDVGSMVDVDGWNNIIIDLTTDD